MTDLNKNSSGYKKTRVGWIPEEWNVRKFKEIAKRRSERYDPQGENNKNHKCIELSNINQKVGTLDGFVWSKEQKSSKNKFYEKDILFGKLRPYLRKYYLCDSSGVCSSEIWVLIAKNGLLPEYLYLLVQTNRFINFSNVTTGTKMPRADWDFLSNRVFAIPVIDEQKIIVEIINTWDQAIEQTQALIDAKQRLKKGLMQQLLTGRKRFPAFEPPVKNFDKLPNGWTKKRLSNFFTEFTQRNDEITDFILSCSKIYGIISQEERFDKRIASKNLSRYKVVQKDDLIYDPMLLWDTSIGFVEDYSIGCVSPAYNTFHYIGNDEEFEYIKYSLFTQRMQYLYKSISQGTNRRRRKAPSKDFLKLKITIPDNNKEIEKIIQVLNSVNKEKEILERNLFLVMKQKQGLMQKLLTGEVRI